MHLALSGHFKQIAITKRKQIASPNRQPKTQAQMGATRLASGHFKQSASTKRQHKTQAQMGAFYVIDQIFGKFFC